MIFTSVLVGVTRLIINVKFLILAYNYVLSVFMFCGSFLYIITNFVFLLFYFFFFFLPQWIGDIFFWFCYSFFLRRRRGRRVLGVGFSKGVRAIFFWLR